MLVQVLCLVLVFGVIGNMASCWEKTMLEKLIRDTDRIYLYLLKFQSERTDGDAGLAFIHCAV